MISKKEKKIVGVISDSHGPLDSWSLDILNSAHKIDHIIHAGDIVCPSVIKDLQHIAPTTFVQGNMDPGNLISQIKKTEVCKINNFLFYVLHDLHSLDLDPSAAGINVVIHGHTHKAEIKWHKNILFFNPGSVNHPRYDKPKSIGLIFIKNNIITPQIIFKS